MVHLSEDHLLNDSILVNVHEDYLKTVRKELVKIGYYLVFKTKLEITNSV